MSSKNRGNVANLKNRGIGRPKGSLNKYSATVKQALLDTFMELGGTPALVAWARRHRTQFYRLLVHLLPRELQLDVSGTVDIATVIKQVNDNIAKNTRPVVQDEPIKMPLPAPAEVVNELLEDLDGDDEKR